MSEVTPPVGESDLHAYVDGQLPAERRPAVEEHLLNNPDAAERVAAYRRQREAIRAAFAARGTDPLPPSLSLARIIADRSRQRLRPWILAASVLLALSAGLLGGWVLHSPAQPGRTQIAMALLEQEALASHIVYAVDRRHPIEVPGSESPHLRQWLSNRLERSVTLPDLSAQGYHLIGGRLLATERGGAAALLMYDDADHHRISLLLRPMSPGLQAPDTAIQTGGVNGQAWIGNGLGIAIVASLPASVIAPLAKQVGAELAAPG